MIGHLLVAAWLLSAFPLHAERSEGIDVPVDELQDQSIRLRRSIEAEKKAGLFAVAVSPLPAQARLGDPWTDETRRRQYHWNAAEKTSDKIAYGFVYESPIPVQPLLSPFSDPFKDEDAEKIATGCKAKFGNLWDEIACVSQGVHAYFKDFKFDGLRSACRSHAQAFNKSFAALEIPRSHSRFIDATGGPDDDHVANAVLLTNHTGVVFAYVIDSGWFPGTFFPQNINAVRFHDRDQDGKTDFFQFPAIGGPVDFSLNAPADRRP